jgi:phospholipase C
VGALHARAAQGSRIHHVVVIDLENHSFDSILGFWCNRNPGRCPHGGMPSSVTLSDGSVVRPSVAPVTVPNVAHNVEAQQEAMNVVGGVPRMNGWEDIHSLPSGPSCTAAVNYKCISGYTPAQVPNTAALARTFAISDMTFSDAPSPSWEGHLEIVAATSDGFVGYNPVPAPGVTTHQGWGCDSNKVTPWQRRPGSAQQTVPSCIPDFSLNPARYPYGGAFAPTPVPNVPTIMGRLHKTGLSWKIYSAVKGTKGYGIYDICPSIAGCLDTSQLASLVPDGQFTKNAAAGTLPAFSIVTPGGLQFMNAGHNGMSITAMDNWVGQLVTAVEKGPDWPSTAVFITWDDCGCFYDQVPPPRAPDGTQEGPRVPLIIVSPYAKRGYTDTTPATFASILAYTEHNFGLSPLGLNDAQAYPFTNAFNYSQAPLKPVRMVSRPLPASARHIHLTPAMLNDPT